MDTGPRVSTFPPRLLFRVSPYNIKSGVCLVASHPDMIQSQKEKGDMEDGYQISWNFPGKMPCLVITLLTRNDLLLSPEAGLGILEGLQIGNKLLICGCFRNGLNM